MNVGDKIICHPIPGNVMDKKLVFGDTESNGHVVIRSSENEQLLYLDGACDSEPIFIGLSKSRGTQSNKLPVEADDFLGGVQVYARTIPGNSLGYNHEQSPLVGAIQFKVANNYTDGGQVLSEFIIGLTDKTGMSVKLKLDQLGNLIIANNLCLKNLTITDEIVSNDNVNLDNKRFFKVKHEGVDYAVPLYEIKK